MVRTIADKHISERERKRLRTGSLNGHRQGVREGILEGKREGEARGCEFGARDANQQTLSLLLTQWFATVPDAVQQRVQQANDPQLDAWLQRVIGATCLEDVFAEP